jgi:hypothetical protein
LTKARQNDVTHCPAETRHLFLHGLTLSILCMITYWLITRMLAHMLSVSRDDDLVGSMWAVVATVFCVSLQLRRECCRCVIAYGGKFTELRPLLYLSTLFPVPPLGNGHADWGRGRRDVFNLAGRTT